MTRAVARWALLILAALALLLIGGAAGFWFASNYLVVPRDASTAGPHGAGLPESRVQPAARPASLPEGPSAEAAIPPATAGDVTPFSLRFTPGERLRYRLTSEISGQGVEARESSGVMMGFESFMTLETQSVDAEGTGALCLTFDETVLRGDFMDGPFEMFVAPDRARVSRGGSTRLDTENGQESTQGIPQVEFFQKPVRMSVASNGQVLDVSGADGMSALMAAVPALAAVEFPNVAVAEGQEWESEFRMPIPGFGEVLRASIRNRFVGYRYVGSRLCGVVEQQFVSWQKDGAISAPQSSLGEPVNLRMPMFTLEGTNKVCFDAEKGQLVKADMDLDLSMGLSSFLGQALGMMESLMQDPSAPPGSTGGPDISGILGGGAASTLDLTLDIKGGMELLPESE